MKITSAESRIEAHLEGHPQRAKAIKIGNEINRECERLIMSGMDPAALCAVLSVHATAMVAAALSAGRVTPELASLLVQDYRDTVRAHLPIEEDVIEDEQPEPLPDPVAPGNDLFIDLPSLANAHLTQVRFDRSYQDMVEDVIGNFNHIVSQGVAPIVALYAMTQGYALTLGSCLRADLPWPIAQRLLRSIMKNAQTFEKMVRTVTR